MVTLPSRRRCTRRTSIQNSAPSADALLSRVGAGNLGIVPALYPKWRSAERPLGEANEIPGLGKLPSGRNHPLASPAGGYDPAERIGDMDKEGIDVAVCFATVATSVCAASDPAMEAALARAYNRWAGEYCGAFPARIKAVGIVPQREMERCAAEVAYLAREPWAVGIMTFGNLDGMLPGQSLLRSAVSKRAGSRPADLFSRRHRPPAVRAWPRRRR